MQQLIDNGLSKYDKLLIISMYNLPNIDRLVYL